MKSVVALLAVSFCLFQAVAAVSLDKGQSYCLVCSERSNRDILRGIQGNCRGVAKGCDWLGFKCKFCKIQHYEEEDGNLLEEACFKASGSNSIRSKYLTYEIDTVNMSNC